MKDKIVKAVVVGFTVFVVLACFVPVFGKNISDDETQYTGYEMLKKVLSETNTIPLDLYPPGHLEWLEALGDDLVPTENNGTMMRNDPDGFPELIGNQSVYIKKIQTSNTLFEVMGSNHKYIGQLIRPTNFVGISQINMEMKNSSGTPTANAEIWQTDLGNNWVFVATTSAQLIDGDYAVRSWDFTVPVILSSNHSYFVGVYVPTPSIVIRGNNNGSAGTGADLNNGIGSSDGYYQESWGSPHNNDRSGAGTGWFTTYSIIADDIVQRSISNIQVDTSRYGLASIGTAPSGKDSLIIITHGRIPPSNDPAVSTAWVDTMSNSIASYLSAHSINNWQVRGYKWIDGAHQLLPQTCLGNAKQQGVNLGHQILAQGYTHVHFIAHSAGAGLIQSATDVIKGQNSSVVIHETFLDPFVGTDFSGESTYGNGANWADNYSTKDRDTFNELVPFTYNILEHAYNVDVTQLDISNKKQLSYWVMGSGTPCYTTESVHGWPIDFYSNTIAGAGSNYEGFGFPLSEVGGNWSYALTHYTVGNGAPGLILGTPDPSGCRFEIPAPSYPSFITDFINNQAVQSGTGTVNKYPNGSLKHTSGSPAWLATFITVSNVANLVTFDAEFQSTNTTAQGLLSIYWDGDTIGSIDERVVQSGFQHYAFRFPGAISNSVHMLGFRLDSFTNIQSIVVMTNVLATFSGVSQAFSLAITGSTNGLLTYQLIGQSGFEYHIQASTNLFDWASIAVLANTNGTVQFLDQDSTNYTQRFYRAVAPY